jgi:hypothetical protein
VQAVHRIRSRLVSGRTRLANQIRGVLAEHGVLSSRATSPSCVRTLLISSGTVEMASATWSGLSLASCNRSWPTSTGASRPMIGGSANSTAAVSYVAASAKSRALAR